MIEPEWESVVNRGPFARERDGVGQQRKKNRGAKSEVNDRDEEEAGQENKNVWAQRDRGEQQMHRESLLRGALRAAGRSEELDRGGQRRVDRPVRIAELGARLRRIEEHPLSRHPHFGQARAWCAASNRSRDRLGAERESECDRVT